MYIVLCNILATKLNSLKLTDTKRSDKKNGVLVNKKLRWPRQPMFVTTIAHSLHIARLLIYMYSNRPIKGITCYMFRYYEWKYKFFLRSIVKAAKYGHI